MPEGSSDRPDPHKALEQFVVDNDDLLALEERIGRFNIFDALGIARTEIRHSNFLAWLLDPNESHGQGSLFLKAVLMDLLKQTPPEMRPINPIQLDGEELRGVEVRREWRSIDILITCDQPRFVIVIENKIDSGEGERQLERYKRIVREHFAALRPMFVFLTTGGTEPSDEDWVSYGYSSIHEVLSRVQRTGRGALGDDVAAFLKHYLQLIGSRFMNDAHIDELCRRIYKNHRQALRLIMDRGAPGVPGHEELIAWLNESAVWRVIRHGAYAITAAPLDWVMESSFQRVTPNGEREPWVVLWVYWEKNQLFITVCVGRAQDRSLRELVIKHLRDTASTWGMKPGGHSYGDYLVRVFRKIASIRWDPDEPPDPEEFLKPVKKQLEELRERLAGVPDALRPIFEEWKQSQPSAAQR